MKIFSIPVHLFLKEVHPSYLLQHEILPCQECFFPFYWWQAWHSGLLAAFNSVHANAFCSNGLACILASMAPLLVPIHCPWGHFRLGCLPWKFRGGYYYVLFFFNRFSIRMVLLLSTEKIDKSSANFPILARVTESRSPSIRAHQLQCRQNAWPSLWPK